MRSLDEISQSAYSTSATEERKSDLEGRKLRITRATIVTTSLTVGLAPVKPHEASNVPFDRDDKESSSCSQRDDESRQVIDFLPNDVDNPTNWPMVKFLIVQLGALLKRLSGERTWLS